MEKNKRYCKECKEEIFGRTDKRFCSDYCRASFYNKAHSETTALIRRVNYKLRKNRRILARFNSSGQTSVSKKILLDSGLNFNYFTNTFKSRSGQLFYFCYDHGYQETENQDIKILTKQELQKHETTKPLVNDEQS